MPVPVTPCCKIRPAAVARMRSRVAWPLAVSRGAVPACLLLMPPRYQNWVAPPILFRAGTGGRSFRRPAEPVFFCGCRSGGGHAAVEEDRLAGQVPGLGGADVADRLGDLRRLAGPPGRDRG